MSKSILFIIMACMSHSLQAWPRVTAEVDEPTVVKVERGRPSFTITEAAASEGLVWLLEPYDLRWLSLKSHTANWRDLSKWTFTLAPAAFSAPHVLKLRLLLGDPETLDNYEYHDYVILTQ